MAVTPPPERVHGAARSPKPPRTPLPLLAGGLALALLLIIAVALAPRATPDPNAPQGLNAREAIALVAREMRSGQTAAEVVATGEARFEDGSWFVSVGGARFRFSERNRIVLAENAEARALQYLQP